ncbi:tRNA pseudouridine synthase-like 1 [Varanus komodoensis]|nr:tRNA pseudouridine synthase-like 1 [Varanus komodoensis]
MSDCRAHYPQTEQAKSFEMDSGGNLRTVEKAGSAPGTRKPSRSPPPFHSSHLNVSAMREAAEFLIGTHDFSTFRSAIFEFPVRSPIRTLAWVDIRPASSFLSQHWKNSELKFWELEFIGRSFLYKQVRRMAGVLVAVGQNRLQPRHVQELLEVRDLMAYPTNTIAPAHGLFLKRVEYYRSDLEDGSTETEPQPS